VILASGLSPAWQRIMVFDEYKTGEVNRAEQVIHCASGKVLNVAIGLKTLGAEVHCLSPVGGDPAASIKREYEELKLPVHWIDTQSKTRTCITILDQGQQQTTELVENAEQLSTAEIESWIDQFHQLSVDSSLVVLSGSLPAGVPQTLFSELLASLKAPAILDIRREELLAALSHHPLVIKPNREELEWTVGRQLTTSEEIVSAAEELRKAGAQWVVISDGPNPVTVVGPDERCLIAVAPVDRVVNPIGCGDSLTAGIAAAIDEGHSILDAVKWGIACSSQNLESLLPARLDRQIMLDRANRLSVERLS